MNPLRETITRWKTSLAAMPIGLRLALTAVPLVALVAIGVTFGLGGGSRTTLLDDGRVFTNDELRQVQAAFRSAGLTGFRVEGQRVRVPQSDAERYARAAASICGAADGHDSEFDRVHSQTNIFTSSREKTELLELARAKELAKIIRGISGIEDASVLWDRSRRTSLAGDGKLTATVSVKPKPGVELTRTMADSLRQTVAGAIADLRPEQVTVLNLATGRVVPLTAETSAAPTSVLSPDTDSAATTAATRQTPVISRTDREPRLSPQPPPVRIPAVPESTAFARGTSDQTTSINDLATFSLSPASGTAMLLVSMILVIAVMRRAGRITLAAENRRKAASNFSDPESSDFHSRLDMNELPDEIQSAAAVVSPDDATLPTSDETSNDSSRDNGLHATPADEFRFLDDVELSRLTETLQAEHPQTVALVLSHVPAESAEAILDSLPNGTRWQVERRMANAQPTGSEIVREVARALQRRLSDRWLPDHRDDNSPKDATFPITFNDLVHLGRFELRQLVRRIPRGQWVLALKAASPELKARILECFPPRLANLLWEEINQLGPLRVRDLDAVQRNIVHEAQRSIERAHGMPAATPQASDADRVRHSLSPPTPAETLQTD